MTPDSIHDLFFAAAGVAGALIGLLFVAISIEHDRIVAEDADQVHRVRAAAALIALTNALTVSLFALIPDDLAGCSIAVGVVGILFVCGSVLSVLRVRHADPARARPLRDLTFLIAQLVVFGLEVWSGIELSAHSHHAGPAQRIGTLVIVSCLIGIYRAWELIGGPEIGFCSESGRLVRDARHARSAHDDEGR